MKTGDRVAIYLPMIPEAVVAMLACARIGAPHTVVFGGFSADALSSRIQDCGVEVVITADGGYRRGAPSALKPAVDEALTQAARTSGTCWSSGGPGRTSAMTEGRDLWWHEFVGKQSEEHDRGGRSRPSTRSTSCTPPAAPGSRRASCTPPAATWSAPAYTHWATFDLKPETDIFWTAADIGWVTGHSYLVYGPLVNGTTSVMYEGTPDTPHKGRWWEIIEKYRVTILYCAPTAIRTFMKWGADIPEQFDLSSLRILGSVGEPINPEAYVWYRHYIGGDRTPVVDTWWQTETGMHMISPMPGVTSGKPGAAMSGGARGERRRGQRRGAVGAERLRRLPGDHQAVAGDAADALGGRPALRRHVLVALRGSLLRRRRGEEGRGRRHLAAGPGGRRDEHVRPPDVDHRDRVRPGLPPQGRRGGRGRRDRRDHRPGDRGVRDLARPRPATVAPDVVPELRSHVAKEIGAIAKPRQIMVVEELPKTRSGKIMRRLLRDIAENRELGDVTT